MEASGKKLKLCLGLLAMNILFIWGNSSLPGEISGEISDFVKDILAWLFGGSAGSSGSGGLIRKLAHFTEFTTLGMCLRWLFGMLREKPAEYRLYPLLSGLLVACVDETIQIFVPLRGPGIRDVILDTAGVLFGIFIISMVYYLRKRSMIHPEECES